MELKWSKSNVKMGRSHVPNAPRPMTVTIWSAHSLVTKHIHKTFVHENLKQYFSAPEDLLKIKTHLLELPQSANTVVLTGLPDLLHMFKTTCQ